MNETKKGANKFTLAITQSPKAITTEIIEFWMVQNNLKQKCTKMDTVLTTWDCCAEKFV
jgi:hypothetical protein